MLVADWLFVRSYEYGVIDIFYKSCQVIFLFLFSFSSADADIIKNKAKLVIVIDDMGHNLTLNKQAINLPGPITFAFLPYAHYSKRLAQAASNMGKDILLHAPMESIKRLSLGKGGMTSEMGESQFKSTLQRNIDAIPGLIGINNHMGSRLTSLTVPMEWTMEVLQAQGLFFLDSKTSSNSVAWQVAQKKGVPSTRRDVFLDHEIKKEAMQKEFNRAIKIAKTSGYAVLIAHPHAMSVAFLQEKLATLAEEQIELASISELIKNSRKAPTLAKVKPAHEGMILQ